MKTRNLLLLTLLPLLLSCEKNAVLKTGEVAAPQTGIIGGEPVRNEDPVAASTVSLIVDFDNTPFSVCTGTLISKNLVLTATHCLESMEKGDISIHIGAQLPKAYDKAKLLKVTNWKTHPNYEMVLDEEENPVTGLNDVALIRLADNAPANAKPVPVLNGQRALTKGQSLLLAGYGLLKEIGEPVYATELHAVHVPLNRIWNNILVTDQSTGQGACSGDSGGPAFLVTKKGLVVVGITRGPHDKALDCRHFGEYTYASMFESFILQAAKELEAEPPQFIDLPKEF